MSITNTFRSLPGLWFVSRQNIHTTEEANQYKRYLVIGGGGDGEIADAQVAR